MDRYGMPVSQAHVGTVADLSYQVAGVADLTGDGKADLLWHHATAGHVWVWAMNGTALTTVSPVATVGDTGFGWSAAGTMTGMGGRTCCGTTRRRGRCGCG